MACNRLLCTQFPEICDFVFSSDEKDESSLQDDNCDTSEDEPDSPELQDDDQADKIDVDPLSRSRASIFAASESTKITYLQHLTTTPRSGTPIFESSLAQPLTEWLEKLASSSDLNGLSDFTHRLPTVEKRLGVCTDSFITYYFLCTGCWKPHTR
ncbi:hypothetical protein K438DRAFT_1768995 [Mycena galopus ATCC 62051]|nr:hypothetical protein K438DRAFT_1768995 [Mycena galopus ATCC 62051]